MKLIDKDVLENAVKDTLDILESKGISTITARLPLTIIRNAPSIDVIPLDWLREMEFSEDAELSEAAEKILRVWMLRAE